MYIKSVRIEYIRMFDELHLEFPEEAAGWHVIIGDNGSGKSSLLRAIAAVLVGPNQIAGIAPVWSDWLQAGAGRGKIEVEFIRHERDCLEEGIFDGRSGQFVFQREYLPSGQKMVKLEPSAVGYPDFPPHWTYSIREPIGWFSASYGPFRRFGGGDEKQRSRIVKANPWLDAHLSLFGEEYALTEALEWIKALDGRRLRAKEQGLAQDEAVLEFAWVKDFINQSGLLPHGARFEQVNLDGELVFVDGQGNPVNIQQLSDGYRSILSLVLELLRQLKQAYGSAQVFTWRAEGEVNTVIDLPGVVLIDEIDAHLHPSWQTRIGAWFRQIFPKLQFIVTTHSPLICRAAEQGSIWRLASPDGQVAFQRIEGVERDRIVYGNILDAYGTEAFGQSPVLRTEAAQAKLKRLKWLNKRAVFANLTPAEEQERQALNQIFATDVSFE